jgi:AraC-like DNA-binding protein
MDKHYLTDYTESIEELSQSYEFLVDNSSVRAKAKSKGFHSTGHGIISKNFYIGNNLTVGLISIEVENSDSIILSIPKDGKYNVILSKNVTKKFSSKRGGIILPSDYIYYEAVTNHIDDLIIIIDMKKLKPIFKKNYNYNSEKITASFINLDIKNKKALSIVNFIKSTLETTINFPDLRESLLIKTDIEELAALYITDLIADELGIPINKKNNSPDSDLVLKAEELIEENSAQYSSIKSIADMAFTTPRTLQLAFKKHRTYSPMNFLKERKLHKARKLILKSQSGSTIKGIVLTVGILDINRFSKHYKQLFGELPSETRQKSITKSKN